MAESKQSLRSRKWISDALIELMKRKKYTEITITDITEKAGVARLTFYRHFKTKDDVLNYRFGSQFNEFLSELDTAQINSFEEALALCFSYWRKRRDIMELLKDNSLSSVLFEPSKTYLENLLLRYVNLSDMDNIQIQFLIGGLHCAMIDHITNDSTPSPEKDAKHITEMLLVRYKGNKSLY